MILNHQVDRAYYKLLINNVTEEVTMNIRNMYTEKGWSKPKGDGSDFQVLEDLSKLPNHLKDELGFNLSTDRYYGLYIKHVDEYWSHSNYITVAYLTLDMGGAKHYMRLTP